MEPSPTAGSMTHGAVLDLLRRHGPATRRDLLGLTHLSRTTLVERVDTLQRLKLIREGSRSSAPHGRPPVLLEFDDTSRTTLAIDLGAVHAIVALTDLSTRRVAVEKLPADLSQDPVKVLDELVDSAARLVRKHGVGSEGLLGVGVSFPGLAGRAPGTIEAPAVLAHWDAVPVGSMVEAAFGVPALLVNDAHAMAYGEYLADGRRRTLIAVKMSTGIGAGLVVDGRLHYGDSNGAGQFGHMRVPGLDELCTCGQRGCLATVASGRALLRRLQPEGITTLDDLARAAQQGHARTRAALTEAGQAVGIVLSGVATMVDPGAILFGGALGRLEPFLQAVRESIQQLTYARTARAIHVGPMVLGDMAAVTGLAALIVDTELEPGEVDRLVATATRSARRAPLTSLAAPG